MELGQTLDTGFRLVARRWRTLMVVMLAVLLPVEALSLVAASAGSSSAGGGALLVLLALLAVPLGTVASFRAIADAYVGRETGAGAALRYALDRFGAAVWLSVLLALGVFVAFLAVFVPGIWLGVAWSLAIPVLLVEGIEGTGALRRSFELVRGYWWATFARLATAYIVAFVAQAIVSAVIRAPLAGSFDRGSVGAFAVDRAGSLVASLFTTPLLAAITMLVYLDLRARKEGADPRSLLEPHGATTFGGWLPPVPPPGA